MLQFVVKLRPYFAGPCGTSQAKLKMVYQDIPRMPDANIVAVTGFSPEPEPAALVPAGAENPIPLDGTWDFVHAVEDYRASPAAWRPIKVPGPWQAQFADLRMRGGTGIYRRAIDIPAGWKRERVFLRFGAVFHIAREFLRGRIGRRRCRQCAGVDR